MKSFYVPSWKMLVHPYIISSFCYQEKYISNSWDKQRYIYKSPCICSYTVTKRFLKIKLSAQLQRLLFCFHLYYVSIQINIYTAVFQRNKKINSIFMQRRNTNTSRHIQKCATINCKEGWRISELAMDTSKQRWANGRTSKNWLLQVQAKIDEKA